MRVRILHVFDVTGGLISRENTWFDSADVTRQVLAWKERRTSARPEGDENGTEAD